jgi:hypothetical protein
MTDEARPTIPVADYREEMPNCGFFLEMVR